MDQLSIQHHIKHLQQKHDELDKYITEKYKQYGNDFEVETLKKQKLSIKDQIEYFKNKKV